MSDELTEVPLPLNPLPKEDRQAQRRARVQVPERRSGFVRVMMDAMAEYLRYRAQGVSREDGIAGLEAVLRQHWPKPTTKFPPRCERCADVGYEELVCRAGARCLRRTCPTRPDEWRHTYVDPCACDAGDKSRPKYQAPADPLAEAGKVKRARGFTRVGR